MTVYSSPCTDCGGAHLGACGRHLGQITHILMWIASTGLMVGALIPGVI